MRMIYYYAMPGQVTTDRYPDLSIRGIAFNCARFLAAQRTRGYLGLGNCNQCAEWAFWHYPCEFSLYSRGWALLPQHLGE